MKEKLTVFILLLLFWVIMSGMFDAFHFSLGLICCALVTYFSSGLIFPEKSRSWTKGLVGMLAYSPWLFKEILLANLHVAWIILHPRMLDKIDPHLIRFNTSLKSPLAKVTLAQSITLTPGTITVNVHEDEFTVFALTRATAEALPGEMEQRVARALERD